MSILNSISLNQFHMAPWVVAGLVLVGAFFLHRRGNWLWPAAYGVVAFFLSSAGIYLYIMSHPTDQRWSDKTPLSAMEIDKMSGGGILDKVVGPYNAAMDTLNGFMAQATDGMNDVIAIKEAMSAARPFLEYAAWSFLLVVPLFVAAGIISLYMFGGLKKQVRNLTKQVADLRAMIDMPMETDQGQMVDSSEEYDESSE